MKVNMDNLLDNLLFNKPIKNAELKETTINVNKILKEDDVTDQQQAQASAPETAPAPEQQVQVPEPDPNAAPPQTEQPQSQIKPIPDENKTPLDEYIKQARKIAHNHQPKGDLVLEISLELEDKDCGKLEIGSEEYETITGWKIILDKYGIKYNDVPNTIKSFRIDAQTKYSQTESDSVGISVELSSDGETLGIQVFYNEDGTIMDDLEKALDEFNRRYRDYIISAINEKVRV